MALEELAQVDLLPKHLTPIQLYQRRLLVFRSLSRSLRRLNGRIDFVSRPPGPVVDAEHDRHVEHVERAKNQTQLHRRTWAVFTGSCSFSKLSAANPPPKMPPADSTTPR